VTLKHKGLYDYSKVIYINNSVKVEIICPYHGSFQQTPASHMQGKGCPECKGEKIGNCLRLTQQEWIDRAKRKHGDLYVYSQIIYSGAFHKIEIVCKRHGSFWQTPHNHLSGKGCPKCNRSKGEIAVENWLGEKSIIYVSQMMFDGCRSQRNRMLKFDFYIPDYNILIEVDGVQHYQEGVGRWLREHKTSAKEYERIKENDEIKTLYASRNKMRLIRIPYRTDTDLKIIIPLLQEKVIRSIG
jgi:Zn finger protein HypA/HybF involved in hydrogenase expression